MSRWDGEPLAERVQWVAMAIHDDWGGEWTRAAIHAVLERLGMAGPHEGGGLDTSGLDRLVGR